jgi:hypothetical protein
VQRGAQRPRHAEPVAAADRRAGLPGATTSLGERRLLSLSFGEGGDLGGTLTEQEWRACDDPETMLRFVTELGWPRKERLFACACGWQVADLLTDPRCLAGLQVAERFADDQADMDEIISAFEVAHEVGSESGTVPARAAALISLALAEGINVAYEAYEDLLDMTPEEMRPVRRTWAGQAVRCVWGPLPFCQAAADSLRPTSAVVALARGIYEGKTFDRLPVLADALQEAGATTPMYSATAALRGRTCGGAGW